MDTYSSDLKLSQVGLDLFGRRQQQQQQRHRQQQQRQHTQQQQNRKFQRQQQQHQQQQHSMQFDLDVELQIRDSAPSPLSMDSSPLYDDGNPACYALDFFETDIGDSAKGALSGFGLETSTDDNQWMEYFNTPDIRAGSDDNNNNSSRNIDDDNDSSRSLPFDETNYDGLGFLTKIKVEEHSYSLGKEVGDVENEDGTPEIGKRALRRIGGRVGRNDDSEEGEEEAEEEEDEEEKEEEERRRRRCSETVEDLGDFKLQFDADLDFFQDGGDMDHDAFGDEMSDLSGVADRKLGVIGDLLFSESQGGCLDRARTPSPCLLGSEGSDRSLFGYGAGSFGGQQIASVKRKAPRQDLQLSCRIKSEPADDLDSEDLLLYRASTAAGGHLGGSSLTRVLPPTPPSSGCGVNSDGEYSNGELSGPPSPPTTAAAGAATSVAPLVVVAAQRNGKAPKHQHHQHQEQSFKQQQQHSTSIFSTPIPSSGILILSEEEKRTLLAEGYSLPSKLPLSKQEEKNLKKIRRKIKNKISAQESRRKKKEYVESLEKKLEQMSQDSSGLKKKISVLESTNRSLTAELQRLQDIVNRVTKTSAAAATTTTAAAAAVAAIAAPKKGVSGSGGAQCVVVK